MSLLRTGRSVVKVSLCHGQSEISLDFRSKTYGAYHYTLGGRSEIVVWGNGRSINMIWCDCLDNKKPGHIRTAYVCVILASKLERRDTEYRLFIMSMIRYNPCPSLCLER